MLKSKYVQENAVQVQTQQEDNRSLFQVLQSLSQVKANQTWKYIQENKTI